MKADLLSLAVSVLLHAAALGSQACNATNSLARSEVGARVQLSVEASQAGAPSSAGTSAPPTAARSLATAPTFPEHKSSVRLSRRPAEKQPAHQPPTPSQPSGSKADPAPRAGSLDVAGLRLSFEGAFESVLVAQGAVALGTTSRGMVNVSRCVRNATSGCDAPGGIDTALDAATRDGRVLVLDAGVEVVRAVRAVVDVDGVVIALPTALLADYAARAGGICTTSSATLRFDLQGGVAIACTRSSP
ncbi:MAG: hypothetical protein IT383_01190 [Deltaproteobacteria bacterium]|nr:hypothetical protein [Deltaproteobacteria bacterium]